MIGCLRTRVRKQPIIPLYFESETVSKFYNLEARPESTIKDEPDKLGVVAPYFYLSDVLSVGRGCELTVSTHDQTACMTFRELLVLTS